MKTLLLAAGLGTRLKPFTDSHPKALAKVNGRTLLEHNIKNLQRFGIFQIVINVHHFADQIIEFLEAHDGFGSSIEISDERAEVLETGGGLIHAKKLFEKEENFIVMNVDILSNIDLKALIRQHTLTQSLATLAVMNRTSSRVFLFDEAMCLNGWRNNNTNEEKIPASSTNSLEPYAFSGIQILNRSIFEKNERHGKFSLVDLYLDLCVDNKIIGFDHTGDLLLDVGKPEALEKAATLFH